METTERVLQDEVLRAEEPMAMKEEYRPSDAEALREYEIGIRFLSGRGCVIRVGCKEIAFENNDAAMAALNAYVKSPYEEGKKWRQIFNN